ncbi:AAA domain-containing protein [Amycolatopsis acidiphila]
MVEALGYAKGWATSTLSSRPNFRCAAATTDLVVSDDASQCSLAQVLPLAYRSKRLVIVGDPQQLPPVVTADRTTAPARRTGRSPAPRTRDKAPYLWRRLRIQRVRRAVPSGTAATRRAIPMQPGNHPVL